MTIPNWIERKANDTLVTEIMRHMKRDHFGVDNAAKKYELVYELLGVEQEDPEYPNTERLFRLCVEKANSERGGMIVSDSTHGYWWAASLEDGIVPAEANLARAATIAGNARQLVENIKAQYGGQMRMI